MFFTLVEPCLTSEHSALIDDVTFSYLCSCELLDELLSVAGEIHENEFEEVASRLLSCSEDVCDYPNNIH